MIDQEIQLSETEQMDQLLEENRRLREENAALLIRVEKAETEKAIDTLTGLPKEEMIMQELENRLGDVQRGKCELAVAYFDLDGFKEINDSFGHDEGDRALKEFSGKIKESLRKSDLFGRLHGDEFVALIPISDGADNSVLRNILNRYIESTKGVKRPDGSDLSISIGCTLVRKFNYIEPLAARKKAEILMYKSKESGGNQFFLEDLNEYTSEDQQDL